MERFIASLHLLVTKFDNAYDVQVFFFEPFREGWLSRWVNSTDGKIDVLKYLGHA